MIRISEVDPADETTLRAFWETEQASVWADREHAIPRSWQRLVAMVCGWGARRARRTIRQASATSAMSTKPSA